MDPTRFRINSDNVVHETIDGEVIVIDLTNGSYYSVSGSGTAIWEMLAVGATGVEIRAALEARFEAEPEAIGGAVSVLLAQLGENALIAAQNGDSPTPKPTPTATAGDNGDRVPFVAPVFERYTDMKDYFLLDPIHEVSAEGWPRPAS